MKKVHKCASYADVYPTVKQKITAFKYYVKFNRMKGWAEYSMPDLIHFLCDAKITRRFLEYCRKIEGYSSIKTYLESTGGCVRERDVINDEKQKKSSI